MQYFHAVFASGHGGHLPSGLHKFIFQPSSYRPPFRSNNTLTSVFRLICRVDDKHFVLLAEGIAYQIQSPRERLATQKSLWKECRAGRRDCWNPADDEMRLDSHTENKTYILRRLTRAYRIRSRLNSLRIARKHITHSSFRCRHLWKAGAAQGNKDRVSEKTQVLVILDR